MYIQDLLDETNSRESLIEDLSLEFEKIYNQTYYQYDYSIFQRTQLILTEMTNRFDELKEIKIEQQGNSFLVNCVIKNPTPVINLNITISSNQNSLSS